MKEFKKYNLKLTTLAGHLENQIITSQNESRRFLEVDLRDAL